MLIQDISEFHQSQTQLSSVSEKIHVKVDMMKKSSIQLNEKMDIQDCYVVNVLSVRLRNIRKTRISHA